MKVLANIQMLRAIAVLMVVAYHIEPYLLRLDGGYIRMVDGFGYSGVDLFFVISGFINYYVSLPQMHKPDYARRFMFKRLLRILPNYWLILIPTAYLVYAYGLRPIEGINPVLSALPFIPLHLSQHIMIPAWTLNYELAFYAVLALLMCKPRLLLTVSIAAFAIVAGAQIMMDYAADPFWLTFLLSPFWLQFMAGAWIAAIAHHGVMPHAKTAILFGCVMFTIAVYANTAVYTLGFDNPYYRALRAWLYLFAYAPILYGFVSLEQSGRWRCNNRLALSIGDASYSLYLWMTPGLFIIWLAISPWLVGMQGGELLLCYALGASFLLVLMAWLWYRIIERPILRLLQPHKES